MARVHVFADESGDFAFSRAANASKFYILTTVTVPNCTVGDSLTALRRELAWAGVGLDRHFHATTDQQSVRDDVFRVLGRHQFRVDATILEKAKAHPKIRPTDARFYQYAWWLHMKYLAPRIVRQDDELLVVGASIGATKKLKQGFYEAVHDVVQQVTPTVKYQVACWDAATEPCLQVADYCSWAIQRKWERNDPRSHVLIQGSIHTEFAPFAMGTVTYY